MKLKWPNVWSILTCMEREKPQKVERGMFLVATPRLTDPNFRQTVVLICEHGSGGSLGLVVNRRTDRHITEVLPKATGLHEKAGFVYTGGPVQTGGLLILHRLGREVPESRPIFDGVCLGGDLDFLEDAFPRDEGEGLVRVYMGYAGWAPGQLQLELSSGSWLVLPAQMKMVFARDPLRVWPAILRAQGGAYTLYATMPPDPSLN